MCGHYASVTLPIEFASFPDIQSGLGRAELQRRLSQQVDDHPPPPGDRRAPLWTYQKGDLSPIWAHDPVKERKPINARAEPVTALMSRSALRD